MTPAVQQMDTILKRMASKGKIQWDRYDIATEGNCSVDDACYMIWDHQRSQRNTRPSSRPDMRFHRMAGYRTRSARYQTGSDVVDAKDIAHSLASDLLVRFQRGTDKDLEAIFESNPQVAAAWANQMSLLNMQVQTAVQILMTL